MDMTIAQIVSKYGIAESLVFKWKKQLMDQGADVFGSNPKASTTPDVKELHAKIG